MKILTAAQMGEVDRLTTERYFIPSILLMENAGRSFVDELEKACPKLKNKRIVILCGRGNNGGLRNYYLFYQKEKRKEGNSFG